MTITITGAPAITADATTPLTVIDIGAGFAGEAGQVPCFNAAAMAKSLGSVWAPGGVPGTPAGGLDAGSVGPNQTWTVFLIGAPNLVTLRQRDPLVTALSRTSNVATLNAPNASLGVGSTVVIQGYCDFDGAWPVSGASAPNYTFANTGPNFSGANDATIEIGYPSITAFDVLLSQSATAPALPATYTMKIPIATVTTDGSGNIATITQIAVPKI
jgi:hypothetical protein